MRKSAQYPSVAYFCAEFGIDSNIPTYAGGLGILAGDTLKEAGDRDYPMTGIGLLYQGRQFIQRLNNEGWQSEETSLYDPVSACLRLVTAAGKALYIKLVLQGEEILVKVFQIRVGDKTNLYFLSTDSHFNNDSWRDIMAADYCCGDENQLRQQLVLSLAGVKLLEILKKVPSIYHLNEGRPCFAIWEIILQKMKAGLNFTQAWEETKKTIVYTNHTILRSGNLTYSYDLVKSYAQDYASQMGINVESLLQPGVDENGKFSITKYALESSHICVGVSKRHCDLLKKEYPEYKWSYITNGVHLNSWQHHEYKNSRLSGAEIWHIHQKKKIELMKMVEKRSGYGYDPNRLVISWARRISGYKQLKTLFSDISRFEKIVKDSSKPIQLLVAGKAHPGDDEAKRSIQETIRFFQNQLSGYAIYIPNYDIALARSLVMGSDVWLNTPEFGKEACGTSGMKALSSGVLNCTVSDGWVPEYESSQIGWILDHERLSESLYETIENEIKPLFYNTNEENIPFGWVQRMQNAIESSTTLGSGRMFDQYVKKLYLL